MERMITIKCPLESTVTLQELAPFQGGVKKRSQKDVDDMRMSLVTDGMYTPFAVWEKPGEVKLQILDGHCRKMALVQAAMDDIEILSQAFPAVRITAETEEDAIKAWSQMNSNYGKVVKSALQMFTASIPNYKAPIVAKAFHVPKTRSAKVDVVLVKLKVTKDKAGELIALLKKTEGVDVL